MESSSKGKAVPAALCGVRVGYQSSLSSDGNDDDTPIALASVTGNASCNKSESRKSQGKYEINPFRRSAKIQRSPEKPSNTATVVILETPKNSQGRVIGAANRDHFEGGQMTESLRVENAGVSSLTKNTITETPQNYQTERGCGAPVMYSSPRQEFILKMRLSEEETMDNCKKVLRKMRQAMTRQKNIALDVQNGVSELEELLDVMKDYRMNWKTAEKERENCRQALNANKKPSENESKETKNRSISQAKRSASSPADLNPGKKPKGQMANSNTETPLTQRMGNSRCGKTPNKEKNPTERRRAKKPKVRPDAVIIRPSEGHSYAEVLRNIKSKVKPEETEVALRGIRRTMGGAILLEMEKGGNQDKFRDSIRAILKGEAEVKDLKPRATLEIRDLDSLSTEEEVTAAVNRATEITEGNISVRLTATNKLEQRRAFVSLPLDKAKELLKTARIKIGWTNCRIRYREETKRCYRCFGTGHLQRECKEVDRNGMGLCIQCGEKGHKRKECKNPPRCCICIEKGRSQVDHLPGTRSCKIGEK